MKVKFFMLAASAAMLMAGCSNEENELPMGPDEVNIEGAGTMNVALKYNMDNGFSRANNEFENGTASESKANDLTIYFFKADKTYLGLGTATNLPENVVPGNGNVEKTISVDVPSDAVKALYDETSSDAVLYVIAVLNNGGVVATPTVGASYADFNKVLEKSIGDVTKDNAFVMTSSNYIKDGKEQALVEITKKHIGVKSNGLTKDPEESVQIAVERVAAKVKVVAGSGVNILGWGLNVTNKSFYPVKEVQTAFYDNITAYEGAGWMQAATWTSPENKRSYWAVDPNYTTGEVDAVTGESDDFDLLDFSQMKKAGEVDYCLENTFKESMQNRNSTTTAVIVGQYVPEGMTDGVTYVKWKGNNYTEDGFLAEVINQADGNDHNITKYYYRTDHPQKGEQVPGGAEGEVYTYQYTPLATANFKYAYGESNDEIKFGDVVIGVDNADVTITLNLAEEVLANGLYTKPAGENPTDADWEAHKVANAVTEVSDLVSGMLAGDVNKPVVYKNGYCYYEVPLRHFNEAEVADFEAGSGQPYGLEHLARYGVVRNNYYTLTVNSITSEGKPITGKPIPTTEKDDQEIYLIDVDIEVLSWTVRNQSVDL